MKISKKDLRKLIIENAIATAIFEQVDVDVGADADALRADVDAEPWLSTDGEFIYAPAVVAVDREIGDEEMLVYFSGKKGESGKTIKTLPKTQIVDNIAASPSDDHWIAFEDGEEKDEGFYYWNQIEDIKKAWEAKLPPEEEAEEQPAAEKPAPAKKPSIKKYNKVAEIQKVIKAPSSKGGTKSGDGQWGRATDKAWKDWVSNNIETLKRLKVENPTAVTESFYNDRDLANLFEKILGHEGYLKENTETDDLTALIKKNAGSASKIAELLGYTSDLSGVHKMVMDASKLLGRDVEDEDPRGISQKKEVSPEEESVEDSTPPTEGASYALVSLRIPKEKFKTRKDEYIEPAREGRKTTTDVRTAEQLPKAIRDDDDPTTLRTFRRMFYVKRYEGDVGAIIIKKLGINHVLIGFKEEGDFIVGLPRQVEESLSRGSLIRRRYYGRY